MKVLLLRTIWTGVLFILSGLFFLSPETCKGDQKVIALPIKKTPVPVIDGNGDDSVWQLARPVATNDSIANIAIILKVLYSEEEIFFLVQFPDVDESRIHKPWVWDKGNKIYRMGDDREDVFVFKWNMGQEPVDLSIYSGHPHKADIWYWKAFRTDSTGFADDKMDVLDHKQVKDSTEIISRTGKKMYLSRLEDSGSAAYNTVLQVEYAGDKVPRFSHTTPSGSRADIRAKGVWLNNKWTIEFARKLRTGFDDDVQFEIGKEYELGVSRFEIAGRSVNEKLSQSLYGAGDVSERLILQFVR